MSRKKIAVLMASIDREYQQDFARGLAAAGAQYDTDICIFNSQGHMNVDISTSETGESMIYELPDLNEFDGIISLLATMGSESAYRRAAALLAPLKDKPHVSIDVPLEGAVTICFDDHYSMREMTAHLINKHGARRFAMVSGPLNHDVALERINACRETLREYGLTLSDRMIIDGEWTRIGGRNAAEKILSMGGQLPDAVICGNDDMALSVIECFHEHGIRVPGDVAVTGFDALREAIMRGVTTICRPVDRSARKAVEVLTRWIDGEKPEQNTIQLPTVPIYGQSCGCEHSLEHMGDKLRAMATERWNMETILTRVSMFSGSLAGVGDEKEAVGKIREFANSWNIREMYLCVDPAICRPGVTEKPPADSPYPEDMLLLFGIRDGREYPSELFRRRDLTPVLQEMRKNALTLVFCPLYYRNHSLGYVAMNLGEGTGAALYSVLMLLNGALMSLYLQQNIRRYATTIEQMAIQDIMTGMLNRRGYNEKAPAIMQEATEKKKKFVMMSVDMDHMKAINDAYGHLMGDEAIRRMGRIMRVVETIGLTPVHISGDEFLAYGILDDGREAGEVTELVRQEIRRSNEADPWIREISASMGIYAAVPQTGEDIDDFMSNADQAMYEEKKRKKRSGS